MDCQFTSHTFHQCVNCSLKTTNILVWNGFINIWGNTNAQLLPRSWAKPISFTHHSQWVIWQWFQITLLYKIMSVNNNNWELQWQYLNISMPCYCNIQILHDIIIIVVHVTSILQQNLNKAVNHFMVSTTESTYTKTSSTCNWRTK